MAWRGDTAIAAPGPYRHELGGAAIIPTGCSSFQHPHSIDCASYLARYLPATPHICWRFTPVFLPSSIRHTGKGESGTVLHSANMPHTATRLAPADPAVIRSAVKVSQRRMLRQRRSVLRCVRWAAWIPGCRFWGGCGADGDCGITLCSFHAVRHGSYGSALEACDSADAPCSGRCQWRELAQLLDRLLAREAPGKQVAHHTLDVRRVCFREGPCAPMTTITCFVSHLRVGGQRVGGQ
jgi:hypothetical protein